MTQIREPWRWFNEARFGLFIHWGAYAAYGRGEQVLFREHLDQREYEANACRWNPKKFDAKAWADVATRAGMKYAVLTTRHHDGFCLWDSKFTDYTTAAQAPKRDFVREYVEAFRAAGLRVGLYYSLIDWRIPAQYEGPEHDPSGWESLRDYVHNQVRELLTNYGRIDVMWFDGAWPQGSTQWRSRELVAMMRSLQPHLLINNRLGRDDGDPSTSGGKSLSLGDFSTPENKIIEDPNRLWESCDVSTWRLWGYAHGERWRPADVLLDKLVDCASKGGNLLLNVGPTSDGEFPAEFVKIADQIGAWMKVHGECIHGSERGEVCEFITFGRQIRKGNNLYLIIRFWDGKGSLTLAGLETKAKRAVLLTTGNELRFRQSTDHLVIEGLPAKPPTDLFPVIRLEFDEPPQARAWAVDRLWHGDPRRMTAWAARRGKTVWVGK